MENGHDLLVDGCALRLVEDQLELLDGHPGRRAGFFDPGDKRLHPLRRHIGEPHHADEQDRLLSSIDQKILALSGMALQADDPMRPWPDPRGHSPPAASIPEVSAPAAARTAPLRERRVAWRAALRHGLQREVD